MIFQDVNCTIRAPLLIAQAQNQTGPASSADRNSLLRCTRDALFCRCEGMPLHQTSARIWPLSICCRPLRVAELRTNLQVVCDLSFSFRSAGGEQIRDLPPELCRVTLRRTVPRSGQPVHIISAEPRGDSGGNAACTLLELSFGALTCDHGTVEGQAGGIAFVRMLGRVQVVTTSGRSLDLPCASQRRLPCWARSSRRTR